MAPVLLRTGAVVVEGDTARPGHVPHEQGCLLTKQLERGLPCVSLA